MKKSLIIVLLVAIVVSSLFAINAGIPFVESGVLIPVWGGRSLLEV